jgi:hypothetical protein
MGNPADIIAAAGVTAAVATASMHQNITGFNSNTMSNGGYVNNQPWFNEEYQIVSHERHPVTFPDGVRLAGDAELLEDRLSRIEKAIGISTRYPDLESKYPELHDIGEKMDGVINHHPAPTPTSVISAGGDYAQLAGECMIMEKLKENNDPNQSTTS